MLRDVFYYGKKPNVHPRERHAKNLKDARQQSRSEHFWIINEYCDYKNFDWEFDFDLLPDDDVWAEDHNNVWPSQHQKDSGTWLCSKNNSDIIIYRNDVDVVRRKNEITGHWNILENIDTTKWDFSWHPDPSAPPYIYRWGCKFFPVELKPYLEYRVQGATQIKYMTTIVELLPDYERIKQYQLVDTSRWDMSWRPDPMDTPFIYVWGNKYVKGTTAPTLEYHVPGATEKKYLPELIPLLPNKDRFQHLENSDGIDYSWVPDPSSPPYIYAWGNQWNKPEDKISIQYVVEGATEYKYMEERATRKPCMDNWNIPDNVDTKGFDFSWEPSPAEPPFIYQFGTQWQKDGGPQYVVKGATEIKYIDIQKVKALPTKQNWTIPKNIDVSGFDFSWHPDAISPPYVYVFATQWALTGGPVYTVPGAIEKKYVEYPIAVALPDRSNWEVPVNVDADSFDFSWHPFAEDDPCIYQIGTQWQKTGGPRYIVPGTDEMSPVKYIDRRIIKSKRLPDKSNFKILHPIIEEEFNFTWHPDTTEEPYIYVFGNQHYSAEKMPTVEYHVEGATQYKFVNDVKARLQPTKDNWQIKLNMAESTWDFTWVPDPGEPPYIYVFGNQWHDAEIESTIEYHVPGATEKKYINDIKAYALPNMTNWKLNYTIDKKSFDFTWRPDPGSPPYIYVFGSNLYPAEEMSTVEYHVEGATEYKFISNIVATLAQDKSRWTIPDNVDVSDFDFSWHPNPKDPPYIYYAGTQWQKSGGPKYIVKGATEIKYLEGKKVKALPNMKNWQLPPNIDVADFDFSWHPDDTEPAYIYQFGTQWALTGGPKYVMPEATEVKYMENPIAKALPDKSNWEVPTNIDATDFDFSWHPYVEDQPYIYIFGTQHQKTGGPRYITPGADDMSPVKYIDRRILKSKAKANKENFVVLNNNIVVDFDYSWHHDQTEDPYIYVFGNQYWSAEKMPTMEYRVEGASQYKYVNTVKATLGPNKNNWHTIIPIDETKWDYTWVPDPGEPPYIYVWGNQWNSGEVESTVEYRVPGATEKKYMNDRVATVLPDRTNWTILEPIHEYKFDFSWRPNPYEDPYVYTFGNNLYRAEEMPTVEYKVPTAKQRKYINDFVAELAPDMRNWEIPSDVDTTNFDFSWKPHPMAPAFIYEFGTQWQKTGGPRYVIPGAKEINYIPGSKALHKPKKRSECWQISEDLDISEFDFSWHPDNTEKPYIYVFGTQWAMSGGPRYVVPGATEVKYMDNPIAKMRSNKKNWIIPHDIDTTAFDFSWHPYAEDQPYIYQFGTQWQKTGGPKYITPGCDEMSATKYIDRRILKAKKLPDKSKFEAIGNQVIEDFDYSWHPDETEPPYIYVFGNEKYSAEIMPTIRYIVEGAKTKKYVNDVKAKLGVNKSNWKVSEDLDTTNFDFTWIPDPNDPPYIYEFGTQWQKTGGPKYVVGGATDTKYIEGSNATIKQKPNDPNWNVVVPVKQFDFSWHPDSTEEPYIYVFGNEKYSAEIMPTVKYIVPGAKKVKYVKELKAKLQPNTANWREILPIDKSTFDYSWIPDPTSPPYIYVFGNQWNRAEIEPTIEYVVPGATDKKYVHDITAKVLPDRSKFKLLKNIVEDGFDYSWRPDPNDPPYIYVFGNQHYTAEKMPTVEYIVDNATDKKYINDIHAKLGPNYNNWRELSPIDKTKFDYSWIPDPHDPPYIYTWGSKYIEAELKPTLEYHVPNATERKYMQEKVEVLPEWEKWVEIIPVDKVQSSENGFDFSWRPDPREPAFIYVFGNQWNRAEIEPTLEYHVPGATEKKYVNTSIAYVLPNRNKFEALIDIEDFDFSWRPDPNDPPYIYVFGNQWNTAEKEPTIRYKNKNGTDIKYISDIVATVRSNMKLWKIPEGFAVEDFDFSWRPDPYDPAYIYEFATEYSDRGGPRYVVDGATETKYMSYIKAKLKAVSIPKYYIDTTLDELVSWHPTETFWALQKSIKYDNFDFNWRPTKDIIKYVNIFGSPDSETTQTYFINAIHYIEGNKEKNYIQQETKADSEYLAELFVQPDIFLVDRGNPESQQRFEQLKLRFTNVSKTRFLNSWVDTINRCINRSNTEVCWILNSELDYSNFDFKYYPNPWQMKMVHVFGTQWSHWGTTFMVNRDTFTEDTKYIKVIEHLSNLNFVKERRAVATNNLYDIIVINHGNKECDKVVASLEARACGKKVSTVDYDTSYVNTLKKIVNNLNAKKEQFVWVTSSVCSYGEFDFTYICDPFARDSLHVFPSDRQKFGDTFLLDVNKAKEFIDSLELLQQYPKVNYNQTIRAKRLSAPVIKTGQDTHVEAIKIDFDFPYAIFQTEDITTVDNEPMNLWASDTKSILITSTGGTRIIVPKEAKDYVKDQLYDYPYIKTASKLLDSKPLDIVFLSNGEKCADENYEHLLAVTKGLKNRVVRVDGVDGRVDAYHAAVKAGQTNWSFTVFAKLKVDSKFDWNWQPDRLQMPKHYIFHAKNPINGLEYGHQGMIAYNKSLTLNNFGEGLDFTLDDPHETVDLLSGVATFNTDSYSTWRTAFREVIKLKSDYTDISQERLKVWLTKAKGKFAKDCLQGANDAVEYYDEVSGDLDQLKLSYEWAWLTEYYNRKYK